LPSPEKVPAAAGHGGRNGGERKRFRGSSVARNLQAEKRKNPRFRPERPPAPLSEKTFPPAAAGVWKPE